MRLFLIALFLFIVGCGDTRKSYHFGPSSLCSLQPFEAPTAGTWSDGTQSVHVEPGERVYLAACPESRWVFTSDPPPVRPCHDGSEGQSVICQPA